MEYGPFTHHHREGLFSRKDSSSPRHRTSYHAKTQVVTTQDERRWSPPSLALTPSLRTSSVELCRSNILRSEYSLQISFKYSNNSKLPEIVKQDYDSITSAGLSSICSVTRIFVICYASRLLSVEPLRVHYGPCIVTSW